MGVVSEQGTRLLFDVATELEATRAACFVLDGDLSLIWASSEMYAMMRATPEELGCGEHVFTALARPAWYRRITAESLARGAARLLPYALAHAQATEQPVLPDITSRAEQEGVEAEAPPAMWTGELEYVEDDGSIVPGRYSVTMLGHPDAGWIGVAVIIGSPLRATVLSLLTRGDEQLFERIASLAVPRQEPAAVLFVDLEESTSLSKRLSTPAYFALIRELLSAVDAEIASHDGVVGKHAGDGATAFFRATDAGGASRAARNAIETAFALQALVARLQRDDRPMRLNIGLHFAPRLYLGQLITSGRLEVTALGDEVNEAARVQESARGGAVLATKLLVEQLDPQDAEAVGLRPATTLYSALADLPTCSEKARRDAAALPVTVLPPPTTSV